MQWTTLVYGRRPYGVGMLIAGYDVCEILYSQKYWQELNLVIEPKITIARILADLNFGGLVQDCHTYYIIICE